MGQPLSGNLINGTRGCTPFNLIISILQQRKLSQQGPECFCLFIKYPGMSPSRSKDWNLKWPNPSVTVLWLSGFISIQFSLVLGVLHLTVAKFSDVQKCSANDWEDTFILCRNWSFNDIKWQALKCSNPERKHRVPPVCLSLCPV